MPKKPTKGHPNRHLHNWLAYRNFDKFLLEGSRVVRGTLYDLGCGESPYRDYLLQHATTYVGVDWQNSIHATKPDVVADLNEELSIEPESADTVFSMSVLEHLHEPSRFLAEAARILKPGSYLVMQVPWQWHLHEEPHDYLRFTSHGLRMMLAGAGFEQVEIKAMGGYFTAATLKFNYFSARTALRLPAVFKYALAAILLPFWTLGQIVAPALDKMDKEWEKETMGYTITARKPLPGRNN